MDYGYISIIELCLVLLEVIRMERFYFKGDWRLFDKRLFFFVKLGIDKGMDVMWFVLYRIFQIYFNCLVIQLLYLSKSLCQELNMWIVVSS